MWRFTRFNNRLNTLKVGLLGTVGLLVVYACSDSSTGPSNGALWTEGSGVIEFYYPDSVKYPWGAPSLARMAPARGVSGIGMHANLLSPTTAAFSSATSLPMYTHSTVPFNPEADPKVNVATGDDKLTKDIPIGFTFNFYGQDYDLINIGSNGIVGFGRTISANLRDTTFFMRDGCCSGQLLPSNDFNNNIIAIAQGDWNPTLATSIRVETRGNAPNRRFLVQFTNVMESSGNGRLTAQLVLYERSNDIVIHTTNLTTTIKSRLLTQGIENLTGTEADFVPGRNRALFSLTNDAVKFSRTAVNKAPAITPPADFFVAFAPGSCTATADIGIATADDDAPGVAISAVRSDNLALDAAYPRGVTSVKWTATDAEGLTASATQNVTVSDNEKPSITAPADISKRVDLGTSLAFVDVGTATATDNCDDVPVKVTGSRVGAPLNARYSIGTTTITWTATDGSGNSSSATQTVTITGNAAPVITPPANISVNTDAGACYATLNPAAPEVKDDTEGVTIVGQRTDLGDLNGRYLKGVLTTIKWTATDADGLTSSWNQTVTVSDKELPVVTAPASREVVNTPHLASAAVSVGSATAEDNCLVAKISGARSDLLPLESAYPVGVTKITWTAMDGSGNAGSALQTITVRDNEAPSLVVPADKWVNATSPSGAVVTFDVAADDNVGVVSVSCWQRSGSLFSIGPARVKCDASDAAGNSASKEFGVKVLGAQEQVGNLTDYVMSLGLSNGVQNPLVNQLRAAGDPSADACKKIDDFMRMVSAKNSGVPSASASYMLLEARRIKSVMGCAG